MFESKRLRFPDVVLSENFPGPVNHTIGSSIPFQETGVYKVSINATIQLINVEVFSLAAFIQHGNIIPTSTIDYFEPIDPNVPSKEFTVSKSFLYKFARGDSVYFSVELPSLTPVTTFFLKVSSNINIFNLETANVSGVIDSMSDTIQIQRKCIRKK